MQSTLKKPRRAKRSKAAQPPAPSFVAKVAITLLGYVVGYLPGLLLNLIFLGDAKRVRRETGRAPDGFSALRALLFVFLWLPLLLLAAVAGVALLRR